MIFLLLCLFLFTLSMVLFVLSHFNIFAAPSYVRFMILKYVSSSINCVKLFLDNKNEDMCM